MSDSAPDPESPLPVAIEVAAVIVGCVLVAVAVLGLRQLWRANDPSAGSDLQHYGVVGDDGMATRAVLKTTDGQRELGTNTRHLTVGQMSAEWPIEARLGLFDLNGDSSKPGVPATDYIAIEVTTTTTSTGKAPTRRTTYGAVGPAGFYLLATTLDGSDTVHQLTPPVLARPSDLSAGATWHGAGTFGVIGHYRFSASVEPPRRVDGPLGRFDDCLVVSELFEIGPTKADLQGSKEVSYSCPGVGEVARRGAQTRSDLVATTRLPDIGPTEAAAPAEAAPVTPGGPAGDPMDWQLSAIGAVAGSRSSSTPPFAPVVLRGQRIVAARAGGPLVAVDARARATGTDWRFYPGNNVGGALDVAPDGGTLLLGTSDKVLYALSADGVLTWSKHTGDAITAVAFDDAGGAVYVSEDNTAVAVDRTGTERWRLATGGPVTSRPGLGSGHAVVAGEDGAVRILTAASGVLVAQIDLNDPITADVTVAGDVALVASREGQLVAIDLQTARVAWRVTTGGDIAAAPAADGDRALVVVDGRLQAYDLTDGTALMRSSASAYVGGPMPLDDGVLVAGADGAIDLLGAAGTVITSWEQPVFQGAFEQGFVLGEGAAWGITAQGVVYRLGPTRSGDAAAVTPSWTLNLADRELLRAGGVPGYPAVAAPDGQAVLLDFDGGVQHIDPATGDTEYLGAIDGVEDPAGGGLIADGVLVVGTRDSLHAVTYPGLAPLWRMDGMGGSAGRPIVKDSTVYWSTAAPGDAGGIARARLRAVDLDSGTVRWETAVSDAIVAAGLVPVGDLVIAAHEPAAYDAATGKRVWSLAEHGPGLGGPAVSPDGSSVAIGTLDLDAATGASLLLVDSATGAIQRTLPLPRGSVIDASDAILWDASGIVVPQLDGGIAAFDADDGSVAWTFQPPVARFGDVGHSTDRIWLELVDGRVVILDRRTGSVLARDVASDVHLDVTSATARPALVQGRMITADGHTIRGYSVGDAP